MAINKRSAGGWAAAGLAAAISIAMPVVTNWEGLERRAYSDIAGVPTVCYGHTHAVDITREYSKEQCDELLNRDLKNAILAVNRHVRVQISDTTRAALASFVYNVGETAFAKSTLLSLLNAGQGVEACKQLDRWIYAGGRRIQGLANRRAEEKKLCLEGIDRAPTSDAKNA